MVIDLIVVKVVSKAQDHCDGTPLMRYTFEVVFDPEQEGRAGETITKYYAVDPLVAVGKMYTLKRGND